MPWLFVCRPRPGSDATEGETDRVKLAHAGLAFIPRYNAYHLAEDYVATHDGATSLPGTSFSRLRSHVSNLKVTGLTQNMGQV